LLNNEGDIMNINRLLTVTLVVGLFEFDGEGTIGGFRDLFKVGGAEPLPPFPLPFLPPSL
jgi:hypothetical protein